MLSFAPPIADPVFYMAAIPAVLIMGISKGGIGGGLGILTVPILTLVVPPLQAAAIMLPILCIMDLFGVRAYWGRFDRVNMRIILPAAFLGLAIAWATADITKPEDIRLILGVISVVFALDYWLGFGKNRATASPNAAKGWFWGTISGFTSFIAHAGGPPISVYLLPQRLDQRIFVGTTIFFFTALNYAKIVPYIFLGQFDGRNLATSALLALLAPVGIWIGVWLVARIDRQLFYRIAYMLVLLVGSKLLWDGIAARF
ncbi:MAG: sulfite exporter TauE/SafE family protein [Alphaproteobacteria bacterium]|nr:sulfite exporter TauE/SafE family protein [Alphaproteobacteria bacterium]